MWATRGGKRPLNHPLCGYRGDLCPPPVLERVRRYCLRHFHEALTIVMKGRTTETFSFQYAGIIIGCVAAVAVLLVLVVAAGYYVYR